LQGFDTKRPGRRPSPSGNEKGRRPTDDTLLLRDGAMDRTRELALRRPVSVVRSHLRALIPMPFRRIGVRL